MMRFVTAYIAGLIFGIGIVLSGMANPAKVLNFFDIAGTWDPSLAFVMGGALAVTMLGYQIVLRRDRPRYARIFHLPSAREIDPKLVGGAALFGIGWGIAGFCPGGVLPVIGLGRIEIFAFVAALVAGILLTKLAMRART
ncbi:hypothetical protein FHS89_000412 [Rubricella aquisinus]|uniref:YeeE/YedE family protein n=2 Tax=Rubricella aquisinus TaxID=2028108 RepID=A0A840WVY7_9RHOB|nr:hypothetical protein [Rubricella aquisinus]